MFNWKKDKISSRLTDTFIGEGTIVEGSIRSEGGVRLEGQLRGDISCKGDVVVGESGFAVSNISADNVILAGQVTGNVHITGKLTITSTGKLYGDMTAATIVNRMSAERTADAADAPGPGIVGLSDSA